MKNCHYALTRRIISVNRTKAASFELYLLHNLIEAVKKPNNDLKNSNVHFYMFMIHHICKMQENSVNCLPKLSPVIQNVPPVCLGVFESFLATLDCIHLTIDSCWLPKPYVDWVRFTPSLVMKFLSRRKLISWSYMTLPYTGS